MIDNPNAQFKNNLAGDVLGGLSAAIITTPMAIGYGIMAFAPLGPEFIQQAVMAGLFSAIFAGFFAAFFGGSPIQITGPKAPLTLIYGTLVSSVVAIQAISMERIERAEFNKSVDHQIYEKPCLGN